MDISLSLLAHSILTLLRTVRDVREYIVKVREVGKRSACYYSLRKAHASRRAQIKKRGGRTIAVPLQHIRSTSPDNAWHMQLLAKQGVTNGFVTSISFPWGTLAKMARNARCSFSC